MDLAFNILAVIFVVTALGLMLHLLLIFMMHIVMPRKVLETYFREPYFSSTEITLFTGFPFGYMRTAMFMRALGFPASGKRRGVEDAYKLAPVWYCKASKYIVISVLINFSSFLLILALVGLYIALFD